MYYQRLIDNLSQLEGVRFVPLYELQTTSAEGVRLIGLRHDVDSNPYSALRAARYLARKGICGSFYLLHTASYYGRYQNDEFVRNPMMAELVQRFIITGNEIGLHNDAFYVYMMWKSDGSESLKSELTWLRSLGAVVHGTVAHNSAPVYRAENYEVFRERVLWKREVISPNGTILPLGKLSEKKLDLSYEGIFAVPKQNPNIKKALKFCMNLADADIRSEAWMRRYLCNNPCCDWAIDYQFWLIGQDKWVAAGKYNGEELFEWKIDSTRLLHLVQDLPLNIRSVLVIHPDYFETEEPILSKKRTNLSATGKSYNINTLKKMKRKLSKIYKLFNRIILRINNIYH